MMLSVRVVAAWRGRSGTASYAPGSVLRVSPSDYRAGRREGCLERDWRRMTFRGTPYRHAVDISTGELLERVRSLAPQAGPRYTGAPEPRVRVRYLPAGHDEQERGGCPGRRRRRKVRASSRAGA